MTRAQGNREAICLAEQPSHVHPTRAAGAASASGSSQTHTASLEHTTVRDSRSWQCQLVDGLACLFVIIHMPQEPKQGRRLRPFQLEGLFGTSQAAGAAATPDRIAHIQTRVRR